MIRSISLIAAMCLALAGCLDTQTPAQTSRGDVGPGPHPVDAVMASVMFGDICVKTLPRFARTRSVLAKLPFRQRPQTGTYYHQNLDLSIKLMTVKGRKACSMVFVSRDKAASLALLMSLSATSSTKAGNEIAYNPDTSQSFTTLAGGAQFTFRPTSKHAGKRYYQAMIIAAK